MLFQAIRRSPARSAQPRAHSFLPGAESPPTALWWESLWEPARFQSWAGSIDKAGLLRDGLLLGILVWTTIAHVGGMSSYHFEDAYITFRYAQNLAEGQGFVFNPGERVLGTSAPLLTLILAFGARLGLDVVSLASWIYAAALAGAGWVGAWILRRQGLPNAGVFFALSTAWAAGEALSYFGMETTLHLFLIVLSVWAALRSVRPGILGILLGLLCLNRYDGVLICVVIGCFLWAKRRRLPWTEASIAFLIFGSWLAFAQYYFGSIFPNTLGAKAGDSDIWTYLAATAGFQISVLLSPLKEGFGQLSRPVEIGWTCLLLLPALALGPLWLRLRPALLMLPAMVGLSTLGYALIGPPPRHQWYHLPSLFLVLMFAFAGWGLATRWWVEGRAANPGSRMGARVSRLATSLCIGALLFTLFGLSERVEARCNAYARKRIQDKIKAYDDFSTFITAHGLQATSVLTQEPGFLTFRTGQRAIDAAGLVSKGIYYHGPEGRRTGWFAMIEQYEPDFVVMSSSRDRPPARMFERFIAVRQAPPYFWLFMDRELYEQQWLPRVSAEPEQIPEPAVSTQGIQGTQGIRGSQVGRPQRLAEGWTIRGRPFENRQGLGYAWSREMTLDFDELVLDFAGSSPHTLLQLVVDGWVVAEIDGRSPSSTARRRAFPVYPWRGRRARLQAIDRDENGALQMRDPRPRIYGSPRWIDDFESPTLSSFWQPEGQVMVGSTEELIRRFGPQMAQGKGVASSLGLSGKQRLASRPFVIQDDRWVMSILDAGGPTTGVQMWVEDRRVLSWTGRGNGRIHMLKWDLRPWKGRRATFVVEDGDADPQIGIAVDSILGLDLESDPLGRVAG